jgi:hypothetical protein
MSHQDPPVALCILQSIRQVASQEITDKHIRGLSERVPAAARQLCTRAYFFVDTDPDPPVRIAKIFMYDVIRTGSMRFGAGKT